MPTKSPQGNKPRIGGTLPRPRVALLGNFSQAELKKYKQLFPTLWQGKGGDEIDRLVSYKELDLIIVNPNMSYTPAWIDYVHVICFSQKVESLPGPTSNSIIRSFSGVHTAEYELPEIELPYSRRRDADFARLTNVKGWEPISTDQISRGLLVAEENRRAKDIILKGAIICDRHSNCPFATIFIREHNNLGLAWLPQPIFKQIAWVELITAEWAKVDHMRFPEFGDWTKLPDWTVPKEEELAQQILALEEKKQRMIQEIEADIGARQSDLTEATLEANKGVRRLLTGQGDELVDEVANIFRQIGFKVQLMDKELEGNKPRREDLRLQDPSVQKEDWEAIVEVRGYEKSGSTTADLARLGRFANFYRNEMGRLPDKRMYVVNGQTGIPNPQQRQEPLISAQEDVHTFAEDNGVVISTIDLFRLAKNLQHFDHTVVRESIKTAEGRWTLESVHKLIKSSE
jgi:hypothetical protein